MAMPRTTIIIGILILTAMIVSCGDDDDSSTSSGPSPTDDDDTENADDTVADDVGDDDADKYFPPDERGPYAVGVTTIIPADDSRWELWGLRNRTLPLEVWYPSTGEGGVINDIPGMIGELPSWALPVFKILYGEKFATLWSTETTALRDAEWAKGQDTFPVVLFSHGLSAIRFQNFTLCEHLASHGFVVVAPDHYDNAIFLNIPGDTVILFNPVSTVTAIWDRPDDLQFIHDFLAEAAVSEEYPWANRLDLEAFGVTGHSYGGLTAMLAGLDLDFVDAIAPLNPAWFGFMPMSESKPLLMLQSNEDQIVGQWNDSATKYFDESTTDRKVFMNLLNAGHYNATDACLLLPPWFPTSTSGCDGTMLDSETANLVTGAYLTAFFKAILVGDDRYEDYLRVNHYENAVEIMTFWP